jgi:hypothetical protein
MTNNSRVLGRPGDKLMLYRMVPVIGTLRCKPLVQCHDQCRVLCAVPNLHPIRERGVLYIDAHVQGVVAQGDDFLTVLPAKHNTNVSVPTKKSQIAPA